MPRIWHTCMCWIIDTFSHVTYHRVNTLTISKLENWKFEMYNIYVTRSLDTRPESGIWKFNLLKKSTTLFQCSKMTIVPSLAFHKSVFLLKILCFLSFLHKFVARYLETVAWKFGLEYVGQVTYVCVFFSTIERTYECVVQVVAHVSILSDPRLRSQRRAVKMGGLSEIFDITHNMRMWET